MGVAQSIRGPVLSLISEGCVLFPVLTRYTVMLGTPEKILEHLLEMMRLDSQFTESGTAAVDSWHLHVVHHQDVEAFLQST